MSKQVKTALVIAVGIIVAVISLGVLLVTQEREEQRAAEEERVAAAEEERVAAAEARAQAVEDAPARFPDEAATIREQLDEIESLASDGAWTTVRTRVTDFRMELAPLFESSIADTADVVAIGTALDDLQARAASALGRLQAERRPNVREPVDDSIKAERVTESEPVVSAQNTETLLARIDSNERTPSTTVVRRYGRLLDRLDLRCTEERSMLGDMAVRATQLVNEESGNSVTVLEVLEGVLYATQGLSSSACTQYFAIVAFSMGAD
jgi:hypothetical protein